VRAVAYDAQLRDQWLVLVMVVLLLTFVRVLLGLCAIRAPLLVQVRCLGIGLRPLRDVHPSASLRGFQHGRFGGSNPQGFVSAHPVAGRILCPCAECIDVHISEEHVEAY